MGAATKYESDYYGWTQEQADLMRNRRLAELDLENLIEEIESMGKAQKEALRSRLRVLLAHLLKWQFQADYPYRRSWELTIKNQRDELEYHLADNPGLRPKIPETLPASYRLAIRDAAKETGINEKAFPTECPWTFEQAMNAEFWPE
jgi:hypothetical protein